MDLDYLRRCVGDVDVLTLDRARPKWAPSRWAQQSSDRRDSVCRSHSESGSFRPIARRTRSPKDRRRARPPTPREVSDGRLRPAGRNLDEIASIGDIQVLVGIHCNCRGRGESGDVGFSLRNAEDCDADIAQLHNAPVRRVGDKEIVATVGGELEVGSKSALQRDLCSGHQSARPIRHSNHCAAAAVRDEDIAGAINGNACRRRQSCSNLGRGARTIRVHLHCAESGVRDIGVPACIDSNLARRHQPAADRCLRSPARVESPVRCLRLTAASMRGHCPNHRASAASPIRARRMRAQGYVHAATAVRRVGGSGLAGSAGCDGEVRRRCSGLLDDDRSWRLRRR